MKHFQKNISDIKDDKHNLSDCAEYCDNNKDCMSFSYDESNNDCRLSTICHPESDTFTENKSSELFVKITNNGGIQKYVLNQNQQCNNLCHNDIIESSGANTVHDCSDRCDNNNNSVSFEYNFDNGECTLREKCMQGTHIEDSNEYNHIFPIIVDSYIQILIDKIIPTEINKSKKMKRLKIHNRKTMWEKISM